MSVLRITTETQSDMAIKVPPPRAVSKLILSALYGTYLLGKHAAEARVVELNFGHTDHMEFG